MNAAASLASTALLPKLVAFTGAIVAAGLTEPGTDRDVEALVAKRFATMSKPASSDEYRRLRLLSSLLADVVLYSGVADATQADDATARATARALRAQGQELAVAITSAMHSAQAQVAA
jgi:hypothetical protein